MILCIIIIILIVALLLALFKFRCRSLSGGVIDRFHLINPSGICSTNAYMQVITNSDYLCNYIINEYTTKTDLSFVNEIYDSIDLKKNILYEIVSRYKDRDLVYDSPEDFIIPIYAVYIIILFNYSHHDYYFDKKIMILTHMIALIHSFMTTRVNVQLIGKTFINSDLSEEQIRHEMDIDDEINSELDKITPLLQTKTLVDASTIFHDKIVKLMLINLYKYNITPYIKTPILNLPIDYLDSITEDFKENDVVIALNRYSNFSGYEEDILKTFDMCKKKYGDYVVTDMIMGMYDRESCDFLYHAVFYNKMLEKFSSNNFHADVSFDEFEKVIRNKNAVIVNNALMSGEKLVCFIPEVIHLQRINGNIESTLRDEVRHSHPLIKHAYEKGLSQYMTVKNFMKNLYEADLNDIKNVHELQYQVKGLKNNPYLRVLGLVNRARHTLDFIYIDIFIYISDKDEEGIIDNSIDGLADALIDLYSI